MPRLHLIHAVATLAALSIGCGGAPCHLHAPPAAAPPPAQAAQTTIIVVMPGVSDAEALAAVDRALGQPVAAPPPRRIKRMPRRHMIRVPRRNPSSALPPRWRGTWEDPGGYRYGFDLVLHRNGSRVDGHFDWKLLEAPAGTRVALRVNDVGREHVRGVYDAQKGHLYLKGYEVSDPVLVATDEYAIKLDGENTGFIGAAGGTAGRFKSHMQGEAVSR